MVPYNNLYSEMVNKDKNLTSLGYFLICLGNAVGLPRVVEVDSDPKVRLPIKCLYSCFLPLTYISNHGMIPTCRCTTCYVMTISGLCNFGKFGTHAGVYQGYVFGI